MILFEEVNYSKIIQLPIQSVFVPIKETPLLVDVPCLEDLLGDKLTAFAPNTTGIPYFKKEDSMSMEMQIRYETNYYQVYKKVD